MSVQKCIGKNVGKRLLTSIYVFEKHLLVLHQELLQDVRMKEGFSCRIKCGRHLAVKKGGAGQQRESEDSLSLQGNARSDFKCSFSAPKSFSLSRLAAIWFQLNRSPVLIFAICHSPSLILGNEFI